MPDAGFPIEQRTFVCPFDHRLRERKKAAGGASQFPSGDPRFQRATTKENKRMGTTTY
jgi:hypothetical protein